MGSSGAVKIKTACAFVLIAASSSLAMKNSQRTFQKSCDVVWNAAVAVAKTQDYRIISISKEDQLISLSVGGVWSGERVISLTLSSGSEGCVGTVQSRFSGLAHSDGPELLSRIAVEMIAQTLDRNSEEFRRYKRCVSAYNASETKCEDHLRRDLEKAH